MWPEVDWVGSAGHMINPSGAKSRDTFTSGLG